VVLWPRSTTLRSSVDMSDLLPPLRALLAALAGVLLARAWFTEDFIPILLIVIGVALLGFVLEGIGGRLLPDHPVAAAYFSEFSVFVPMAGAAFASAAATVVTIKYTLPSSITDPIVTETTAALSGGLTTFLTAAFVSNIGDKDFSWVSNRIKKQFRSFFVRETSPTDPRRAIEVEAGSAIEQLVHSDFYRGLSGWDRETRLERAKAIADELAHLPRGSSAT